MIDPFNRCVCEKIFFDRPNWSKSTSSEIPVSINDTKPNWLDQDFKKYSKKPDYKKLWRKKK